MKQKSNQLIFEDLLSTVKRANNHPVVLSKWGFRIEKFDGENFLIANSREEMLQYFQSNPDAFIEQSFEEFEKNISLCVITSGNFCKPNGCAASNCFGQYMGGNWVICRCG